MTPSTDIDRPASRRWRIFMPTILFLLLALGWSAAWVWAAGKADAVVDAWIAREARKGRTYACGERHVGGYPFRIEVDCANPTARVAVEGGEAFASAPRLLAVAQVYDPSKLIAELTGPVAVTAPKGRKADLAFSSARASMRLDGRRFQRGSLVLKTPRLVVDDAEIGTAAEFQAHFRVAPDKPEGAYDFAASVDKGVSPMLDGLPLGAGPVDADLRLEATEAGALKPLPIPDRLRAFAAAGGRLTVAVAKVSRGPVGAFATGDLTLDMEGRVNGALQVTARGVDGLVKGLAGGEEDGGMAGLFGFGAEMLGKSAELDGMPATRYRLKVDKGRVKLGPVSLTRLPAVF